VTGNTLKNASNVSLTATVTMYYNTPSGTCTSTPPVAASGALNVYVLPALPNDVSVTGLSAMTFPTPITID
jgi:hypothetical protein